MENENLHKGFSHSIKSLINKFGPTEKIIFYVFGIIFLVSGLKIISDINNSFLVEVPAKGGTLREGALGSPRFINPLLAMGDTDKAIVSLVYSGLLKPLPDGTYANDLAESYSVSDDGLTYYFKLKNNIKFHDGKPVTTDDVVFTIQKALDPVIKSQHKSNWDGVGVEKVSDTEIVFTLKKPYSPFLESLTMGILPKHVWENISSEEFAFSKWNLEPIGSGPYKIASIAKDSNGITTTINLQAYRDFYPEEVKISNIVINFFPQVSDLTDAFKAGSLDAIALTNPSDSEDLVAQNTLGLTPVMPRIFGAFFNQNKAPVLSNIEVRRALDYAVDKQAIVDSVLGGYGVAINGPTPQEKWQNMEEGAILTSEERIKKAREILTSNGWKPNANGILEKKTKTNSYTLKFTISTSDVSDLKKTAEILVEDWKSIGALVDLKVFESSDLNVNVIKPRNYEVLLFGEVVGREMDLYPFWHSGERNDPGLNIALYTNITVDKLLDKERSDTNQDTKNQDINSINDEIKKDVPAVFLYSPKYIYLVSNKVMNIQSSDVGDPSERFLDISNWYMATNKIWKFFQK